VIKPRFCSAVALTLLLFSGCSKPYLLEYFVVEDVGNVLVSINIIDQNGISETVTNAERLKQYASVDFLAPHSFQKVLRVFQRDCQGDIHACITTYHPNGQLKQYLDVINGHAFGAYREWFANGQMKVDATIVGGNGDLYDGVENSWLFEGICTAWDEEGHLLAKIPYTKGKLEGVSLYYHSCGAIWKQIPFQGGNVEGMQEIFLADGSIFETTNFCKGLKEGPSRRYWKNCALAVEESYCEGRLLEGCYRLADGTPVGGVVGGNGFKVVFGKERVQEFQEYQDGVQAGIVRQLDKKGSVVRTFHMKNGMKDGEEISFYPRSTKPQLSIEWSEGKIHGLVKTWFPDGIQESQREMARNKKSGLLTAWYKDGSVMLIEEYDQDKLVKGEYYQQRNSSPISQVIDGKGVATFYSNNGEFIRKVNYRLGWPEE